MYSLIHLKRSKSKKTTPTTVQLTAEGPRFYFSIKDKPQACPKTTLKY